MYLRKIAIKNIGPISKLLLDFTFDENGNPKPVIFVGKNGAGKTILLSQIIDSFYEISSNVFENVSIHEGIIKKYYKLSGGVNIKQNENSGYTLLSYSNEENKIEYFDKIGMLNENDFTESINDFSLRANNDNNPQKAISNIDSELKKIIQEKWLSGVYFYQPAYRYEEPFWKNISLKDDVKFDEKIIFTNHLDKEIEIISANKKNKSFLMDLVLDFCNNPNNILDKITWNNVNEIIRNIKQRDDIRFGIGPRGGYRVSIVEILNDGTVKSELIPSIDHLSLGESILLNLFINIIRHGDKPTKLASDIRGIVAIDEIDVHLHSDLQYKVLPTLIKMFPLVQFIITTHSPLFLLGMKNMFNDDGFQIINMPEGNIITTENFSEFEKAYNFLKITEKFENKIRNELKNRNKPVVYVEGPTDVKYIKKAYELYDKNLEFDNFYLNIIGEETKFGTNNSNNVELKNAEKFLKNNTNILNQKVILLNDPEEKITESDIDDLLFIRKMKHFSDCILKKGIENLFETDFLNQIIENNQEYFERHFIGKNSVNVKIMSDKKMNVCDWICTNGKKENFKNFEHIFEIINNTILKKSI